MGANREYKNTVFTKLFSEPVALILVSLLHFFPDSEATGGIIATLMNALPPGSYLVATHAAVVEYAPEQYASLKARFREYMPQGTGSSRDSGEFARMAFAGLELIPPGVVLVSEWRPDDDGPRPLPAEVGCVGGVARKPA